MREKLLSLFNRHVINEGMLDPKNYELEHFSYSRSAGARLKERYRSSDSMIGPHENFEY